MTGLSTAPACLKLINHPSDTLGDSTTDVDRTDLDIDRRFRRSKFILVGESVQMAWKSSGFDPLSSTLSNLRLTSPYAPAVDQSERSHSARSARRSPPVVQTGQLVQALTVGRAADDLLCVAIEACPIQACAVTGSTPRTIQFGSLNRPHLRWRVCRSQTLVRVQNLTTTP